MDSGSAIDDIAAWHDSVGQARIVLPLFLAGLRIESKEARVGSCYVNRAVINDRLRFLTALLFTA